MNGDILAVGIERTYLHDFLPCARLAGSGLVIPAYNIEKARNLLFRQDFLAVLIDLDCILPEMDSFLCQTRLKGLPVLVLGSAGAKYFQPVEQKVERFLPYSLSPERLCEHITELLLATGKGNKN